MARMLLAGVRRLVDWNEAHQTTHTVAAAFVTLPLHIPCHLPRSVPRCFQKLLIDDGHEAQVFGAS